MTDLTQRVNDAENLLKAIEAEAGSIEVLGSISGLKSLRLPAGVGLRGGPGAELRFEDGQPGLMLCADNDVSGVRLVTDETQIALGFADEADDLGLIRVCNVRAVGRVHLEAARALKGHLVLADVHVERADARMAAHRPAGYGVEVLLGGISVYNFSKNPSSRWTLEARNLSGGSKGHPLRGSGVFIFGGWFIPIDANTTTAPAPSQPGGVIELTLLTTGVVHANGGIPKGIGNLITGGVFVGSGVHARQVVNEGPTTTYGQNDMVLDNWGAVDRWTTNGALTSFGGSGIGFVNFGDMNQLTVSAPIVTRGIGARGFNLYDGSLTRADFDSITTYGDGAIGVQLSRPFGTIIVRGDVRTLGGEGDSLVRGKVVHLKAHAISLKPGAIGEEIRVGGAVVAENPTIPSWDFATAASVVVKQIEVAGEPLI
jgi:hypothetical protein